MSGMVSNYESFGDFPEESRLPIVYHEDYNIAVFGFEKWSRFDAWKLDRIFCNLVNTGILSAEQKCQPKLVIPNEILAGIHKQEYLQELANSKMAVIRLTEIPSLILLPMFLIQRKLLYPLKLQATGTVFAVGLAIKRGWAINIGGGMIHAAHDHGVAWSPYDDLTLAVEFARQQYPALKKAMIIDLGAHQGNGYARNKIRRKDEDLVIVDVYNEVIFPQDLEARKAINIERKLCCGASSETYMEAVKSALKEASEHPCDLILYAAGTNVLEEDYSGQIKATKEDIIHRDELVFRLAKDSKTPICMVTSSGYSRFNFETVSASIDNLVKNVLE